MHILSNQLMQAIPQYQRLTIIFLIGIFVGSCAEKKTESYQEDQLKQTQRLKTDIEQPHKSRPTQWDDSYLKVRWGSSKSLTKQSMDKSLGTKYVTEAPAALFHRTDNNLDDDRLTFVDIVNGKPVRHNYYFGGKKFYMFVKDLSSQESDVQSATAQELRKLLNNEFGTTPSIRRYDRQTRLITTIINYKTVIETWENDKLVADLNYETSDGGSFTGELQFSLFHKETASNAAQLENERFAKEMSKRNKEVNKSAKKLLQ